MTSQEPPTIHLHVNTSTAADEKTRRVLQGILRRVTHMAETIETIKAKLEANTAAAAALQVTVDAVQEAAGAAFASLTAQIADLTAQLAAGTPIGQDQLDALGAVIDAQTAALASITQDVADTPVPAMPAGDEG